MSTDPVLGPILDDLAAGRIDAAEASRRIDAARAEASDAGRPDEGWRAFAREEAGHAPESGPAPSPQQPSAETPRQDVPREEPRPAEPRQQEPTHAGASGQGADRVAVRSVGRRVRIVGDWSVPSVAVTGPHTLRRTGRVLEVTAEGQPVPLENFSLLKLPRSFDDLKNLGLGAELVVQVNPRLAVDAEVTGSGLTVDGVPTLGRIRVSAGAANLRGVRHAGDVLVQMGSALVEGPIGEGRSRVKCESGGLTVNLTEGANVTVRGTANVGRIAWPGDVGAVDEWVVGNGAGRLDVEIVMGMASVKDSAEGGRVSPADRDVCPSCGAQTGGGRFCPQCGTAQSAPCAGCGAALPAGAKFCPECGTAS